MSTRARGPAIGRWVLTVAVLGVVVLAASTPSSLRFLAHWGVRAAEAVRPGPESVRHVDVDGLRLRYLDEGTGEAVVLVHGFGSSIEHNWVRPGVVERLTEAGYRVLALDVRGHGGSDKPYDPARYGEAELADPVRLMDHAGVERAHLVGYSRGAMLAHHALDRFPERFITVTLGGFGSQGDGSGPIEALPRDKVADSLEAGSLGPIIRALTPTAYPPSPRLVAIANGVISATNDMHALAAAFRAEPAPIPPVRLRANPVPALVLVGELDPFRKDADAMVAVMTGARVHVVPGAGHRDAPAAQDFAEALVAFLRAHGDR
jgi:pimeloyl-ACP methyl ester carboxylesterase